jgi:hypothetical protein
MDGGTARAIRQAHATAILTVGERFTIERGELRQAANGHRDHETHTVTFLPEADIQKGDVLRAFSSRDPLYVWDVDRQATGEILTAIVAHYETEAERQRRLESERRNSTPSFHMGDVHNSIVGTQQHAHLRVRFDQAALNADIDRHGGEDKEELRAMVAELWEMLDDRRKIDRGSLAQHSELIERHSWIAGALAQTVLGWLVGSLK